MNAKEFANYKQQVLKSVDLSRKSEIDEKILPLVEFLNSQDCYVTLSSCSGRSIVFSQGEVNRKNGCVWVYTTHGEIDSNELVKAIEVSESSNLVFKYEPFILHVGCRELVDAKRLLNIALDSGYRNSGIVIGKAKKLYIAIRSAASMEIPLSVGNKLMVSTEYLNFISKEANRKLQDNFSQIEKLEKHLMKSISEIAVPT